MNKEILWVWLLKNTMMMLLWTLLALVFGKWWIALFAILFMSSIKINPSHFYYRICDKCGKHSKYTETYDAALEKAKDAGWVHIVDGNKDYCPDCKDKR